MTTEFNKRAELDALLSEKVSELKRICHMHKIPMFVTFCIENNEKAKALFIKAMEDDQKTYDELTAILFEEHYNRLIKEGKDEKTAKMTAEKTAIEDARFVLPNACETKIVATFNARSLFNFFNHRCCTRAQWEIRDVADEMLRLVKEVAPTLFKKAGPSCVAGACPEGKMTCGKAADMRKKYLAEG